MPLPKISDSEFNAIIEELKEIWKKLIETTEMNTKSKYIKMRLRWYQEDLVKRRIELRSRLNRKRQREEAYLLHKSKNESFPEISRITLKEKVKWGFATNEEIKQFYNSIGDMMLWKVGYPYINKENIELEG